MIEIYVKRGEGKRLAWRKEYDLQFPDQCACCNAKPVADQMYITHKAFVKHKLVVPYCSKHAKVISYYKILSIFLMMVFLLTSVLTAVYLQTIWGRGEGTGIRSYGLNLLFGFIAGFALIALIYLMGSLLINKVFGNEYNLDDKGSVVISTVGDDNYSLSFINKEYADSFAFLNEEYLFSNIQDEEFHSNITNKAEPIKENKETPVDEEDPFP